MRRTEVSPAGRLLRPDSRQHGVKDRRNRRGSPLVLGFGMSQMFAVAKLARMTCRVKLDRSWQRETKSGGSEPSNLRRRAGIYSSALTSTIPTARCGPACRVVWEGSASLLAAPIPMNSRFGRLSEPETGSRVPITTRMTGPVRRRPTAGPLQPGCQAWRDDCPAIDQILDLGIQQRQRNQT